MFIGIKKRRRAIVQPQLIAMLDVCSMITIFLVLGTSFGPESIVIPPGMILAKSFTPEAKSPPVTAPQIVITDERVQIPFLKTSFAHAVFDERRRGSQKVQQVIQAIHRYLAANTSASVDLSQTLNVVADRGVPYSVLFDVVTLFREGGFQAMSFIATGEAQ